MRIGKSVNKVSKCSHADRSVLIHYKSDTDPGFHFYETEDTALDLGQITHSEKSRFIQFLVKRGCQSTTDGDSAFGQEQPNDNDSPDVRGNANSVCWNHH